MRNKRLKRLLKTLGVIILFLIITGIAFYFLTRILPPVPPDRTVESWKTDTLDSDFYLCKNNWLKKSNTGLWEMYLEGKPFDRGVIGGKLSKSLIYKQEKAFVDQIEKIVPSRFYQRFLKYFIYWFNRKLDRYIPLEYQLEIYGISLSASNEFSFIGNNYQRMLNYHSAHDIGHALQDLSLVGCTSFGAWNELSEDSSLVIGRNFDFYMGDAFAENKIVLFEKPDHGYPFVMITWGGMIGAVSGMNLEGITVTLNAAKSDIPFSARTPISLLAREILQYAKTIPEALSIAEKRQTFVSESILIGSGNENKAAIIEKTPFGLSLFEPAASFILCANHFQSEKFLRDPMNMGNMKDNASAYRYHRVMQDLTSNFPLNIVKTAEILRDQKGLNGKDIGMGNEKAINQLIAHHAVIFKPQQRLIWVSTPPWQLGSFVCYDLNKIFHNFAGLQKNLELTEPGRIIPRDAFLETKQYQDFLSFRSMKEKLLREMNTVGSIILERSFFDDFVKTNPEFFEVYSLSADYFRKRKDWRNACNFYRIALSKEIPKQSEKNKIIKAWAECIVELNKSNP